MMWLSRSASDASFSALTMLPFSLSFPLMSGKLRLKGNMVKALKLASLADRLNHIMAQIPTIY